MIYTDFESILVTDDNGKQYPEEFLTNKYQKLLFAVMAIRLYVLIIIFANLLRFSQVNMRFTR